MWRATIKNRKGSDIMRDEISFRQEHENVEENKTPKDKEEKSRNNGTPG